MNDYLENDNDKTQFETVNYQLSPVRKDENSDTLRAENQKYFIIIFIRLKAQLNRYEELHKMNEIESKSEFYMN